MNHRPTLSRRTVLAGALGVGAGAGIAALAGCGPTGGSTTQPSRGARVDLPTFRAYTGVTPDGPATASGAAPFFREFPSDPPRFVSEKPMSGGSVSALTILATTPTTMEKNGWWQAINAELGGTITQQGTTAADYVAKFQAMVAGDELPDLAVMLPGLIPAMGDLLRAKFADLTPMLSGDAVLAYPGLANIPTNSWRGCLTAGAIRTVPIPRFSLYRSYLLRADIAEKRGAPTELKSGEDLLAMVRGLSDSGAGTFATASAMALLDMVNEMKGTPNGWAVDDKGGFTKDWESPTFAEALAVVSQLWRDRAIHPTSFQANLDAQGLYDAGVAPLWPAAASWAGNAIRAAEADPSARTVPLTLPKWDGSGQAGRWLGSGAPYQVAIKQTSQERVAELLRVINWFASPWGTAENLLSRNGIEGQQFTVSKTGAFTRTAVGKAEFPSGLQYVGSPAVVHQSADPAVSRLEYENAVKALEHPVPLATLGLESPTDLSKGASLTRDVTALIGDIIQGRKTVADWDPGIKAWRDKGGDKIREEYQQAHAANQ